MSGDRHERHRCGISRQWADLIFRNDGGACPRCGISRQRDDLIFRNRGLPVSGLRQLSRDFRWGHPRLIPASAEAHREAKTPREYPTDWARRPTASAARAVIQAGVLKPLMHNQLTPMVTGLEVLAELGKTPCIIVANHSSHLDTAMLVSALPSEWRRRTAVAAAQDYFFEAWWRAASTALIFGAVPIERRGGVPSQKPGELLGDGWNIVVFPEGTRSKDGWQGRFRLGAANLALTHDVPVVPVAITGTYAAMPRGRNWPTPGRPRVGLRFGMPVHARDGEDAIALTTRLAEAVTRLQDEGASDWYSSLRRSATVPAGTVALGAVSSAAVTVEAVASEPAQAVLDEGSWRRTWESTRPVPGPVSKRQRVWK